MCQRRHPKDCVYGNQCGFKSCNHLHPPLQIIETPTMETVLLLQKDDDYPSDQNTDLGEELTRAYRRIALLEEGMKREMEEKDMLKEKFNFLTDNVTKKHEVMTLDIDCLKGETKDCMKCSTKSREVN